MYTAKVITVSDRCSRGEAVDLSGPAVEEMLKSAGYELLSSELCSDDPDSIRIALQKAVNEDAALISYASLKITPRAVLSRSAAGIKDHSLIINLPGSPKGAKENLEAVISALEHGLKMLRGGPQNCSAES